MSAVYSVELFLGRRLGTNEDPAEAVRSTIESQADSYEQLPVFRMLPQSRVEIINVEEMGYSEEVQMADLAASTWACTRYF